MNNQHQKIISKISSLAITAAFIALFIYLLPSILVILGVLVLIIIAAGFFIRFRLRQQMGKMNASFSQENNNPQNTGGMKDVTHTGKAEKIED